MITRRRLLMSTPLAFAAGTTKLLAADACEALQRYLDGIASERLALNAWASEFVDKPLANLQQQLKDAQDASNDATVLRDEAAFKTFLNLISAFSAPIAEALGVLLFGEVAGAVFIGSVLVGSTLLIVEVLDDPSPEHGIGYAAHLSTSMIDLIASGENFKARGIVAKSVSKSLGWLDVVAASHDLEEAYNSGVEFVVQEKKLLDLNSKIALLSDNMRPLNLAGNLVSLRTSALDEMEQAVTNIITDAGCTIVSPG